MITRGAIGSGLLACELAVPNSVGLIGLFTQPLLAVRFVLAVIPLEPDHLTVPFKRENVGGDPVQEPAIVAADHGAAGKVLQSLFQRPQRIDIEIVDLRTLVPLDVETILSSVKKTGRALVLHEDTLTAGMGGEISALINEHAFEHLDAPVMRVASWDTPVPFAIPLEQGFLPKGRLKEAVLRLAGY